MDWYKDGMLVTTLRMGTVSSALYLQLMLLFNIDT